MPSKAIKTRCECFDANDGHSSGAVPREDGAGYEGYSRCKNVERLTAVYRTDMEDCSGTLMCCYCRHDAMTSGVFSLARS